MSTSTPLLLALWREVGRHAGFGDSAAELLKLLAPELPLEALVLVHLLPDSHSAEVMVHEERGTARVQQAEPLRFAGSQYEALKRWCAGREVSRGLPAPLMGLDLGDDAREVLAGQECGMRIEGYDDVKAGDVLECYRTREVKRKL